MDDERVKAIDAKLQSLLVELNRCKDDLAEALKLADPGDSANVSAAAHRCSFVLVQFEAVLDEARRLVSASPKA
jgi:hypothetical protein